MGAFTVHLRFHAFETIEDQTAMTGVDLGESANTEGAREEREGNIEGAREERGRETETRLRIRRVGRAGCEARLIPAEWRRVNCGAPSDATRQRRRGACGRIILIQQRG